MSEYVRQEVLDAWIVAHDGYKARAEAAERKVARICALAEKWDTTQSVPDWHTEELTAALADEEGDR